MRSRVPKQLVLVPLAAVCAVALVSCGETVSSGKFKGEAHNVAEAVASFQKDATAGDQKKLCENDLAQSIVGRLHSAGGCQAVLKEQLGQVDALNLTVESVAVKGATAQARVKSTWSGSNRISTLSLMREAGHWKISGSLQ